MSDTLSWMKSSHSNGNGGNNCVETAAWRKASYSGPNAACVEVGPDNDRVLVRDTKDNGTGPILSYTRDEWTAFIAGVKDGEFDPEVLFP